MTIQQFHEMDDMEKVSAIMQFGRLMAQNSADDRRVFLYHLDSFYVSASYRRPDDMLAEISCYMEVDQLIPHYRKHIIFIDPSQRQYGLPGA